MATLTFVDSAGSTSSTITVPATAAAGDLAVLFDFAYRESYPTPSDVVPPGWIGIVTDLAFYPTPTRAFRIRVSYKILSVADVGSTITGMNDTLNNKVMLCFRSDVAISSITPSTWSSQATRNNPNSQAVSASGKAVPLIVLGCAAAENSTAAFSTASPAFDGTASNSDSDIIAGYKIYNSGPADHTVDMNDLGTNALVSGYLIAVVSTEEEITADLASVGSGSLSGIGTSVRGAALAATGTSFMESYSGLGSAIFSAGTGGATFGGVGASLAMAAASMVGVGAFAGVPYPYAVEGSLATMAGVGSVSWISRSVREANRVSLTGLHSPTSELTGTHRPSDALTLTIRPAA